jgi:hypothetical protein
MSGGEEFADLSDAAESRDGKEESNEVAEAQDNLDRATYDAPAEVQKTVDHKVSEDIEAAVAETMPSRKEAEASQKTAEVSEQPDTLTKDQAEMEQAFENAKTSQKASVEAAREAVDAVPDSQTDDPGVIEPVEKKEGENVAEEKEDPSPQVQAVNVGRGTESFEESMAGAQPGELRGFTETSEDNDWSLTSDGTVSPPDVMDRTPLHDSSAPRQDELSPVIEDPKLPVDQEEVNDDQDSDTSATTTERSTQAPAAAAVEEMIQVDRPLESASSAGAKAISPSPDRPESGMGEMEGQAIPEPSSGEVQTLPDLSIMDPDDSLEDYHTLQEQKNEQRTQSLEEAQEKMSDQEPDTSLLDLILDPVGTVMEDGSDLDDEGQSTSQEIQPPDFEEFSERLESYMDEFPDGDVMSSLFYVFKESIEEGNEDKRYFLSKLAEMNTIAEAMGEYLKDLNEASITIESAEGGEDSESGSDAEGFFTGSKYSPDWSEDYRDLVNGVSAIEAELSNENLQIVDKVERNVWQEATPIKKDTDVYELTKNNVQSEAVKLSPEEREEITAVVLARTGNSVRSTLLSLQEESRSNPNKDLIKDWSELIEIEWTDNNETDFQSMFENFDQKAQQLFNILSTVMKGMKEMKASTKRNIN